MSVVLTTTSSSAQTWTPDSTCPVGTTVSVEVWGAGSGASGGSTSDRAGGAGGGYTVQSYTITSADASNGITYFINAGSAGVASANSTAGPDSYFGAGPNLIPNTTNQGAATPSTWPTGWSTNTRGIPTTIAGFGSDDGNGRAYIDIAFNGQATSTANAQIFLNSFSPVDILVRGGQAYTASIYTTLQSGTAPVCRLEFDYQNGADGTTFSSAGNVACTPTGTTTQFSVTRTAAATDNGVALYFFFAAVSGTNYTFTVRLAGLQFELGSAASAWQATPPVRYALARGGGATSGTTGGAAAHATLSSPPGAAFAGGSGATRTQGGGGGGSAGAAGAGASATSATGGTADNGSGGAANTDNVEGGGGGTASSSGHVGGNPGGGGGANTSTGSGGAGGRGQVRLTWVLQASATLTFDVLSVVATAQEFDLVNATNTVLALSCVGTASLPSGDNASAADTFFRLSSAASISDWAVNFGSTVLSLNAVGSAQQFDLASAADTFFTLSSVASISDWSYAVATWTLSASGQAQQFDLTAATDSFFALSATAALLQSDVAQGTATVLSLSPVATISDWAVDFGSTVLTLNTAGSAQQFDLASAADNVLPLSTSAFISDWAYEVASVLTLTTSASLTQQDLASGTGIIEVLSCAAQAAQFAPCSSADTVLTLNCVGSLMNPLPVSAADTVLALTASVQLGQDDAASSTDTCFVLSCAAVAVLGDGVSARIPFFPLTPVAFISDWAVGSANALSLSIQATISDWSFARDTIFALSASASAHQLDQAAAADNVFTLSCRATAIISVAASAADTFAALVAAGEAGQVAPASSTGTVLSLACTAAATGRDGASCVAAFFRLSAASTVVQQDQCTSSGSALALSAIGAANQQDPIVAAITWPLFARASVDQFDLCAGLSSVVFSCNSLAQIGAGVLAHAHLNVLDLSAVATIRAFQPGESRIVCFATDNRAVWWASAAPIRRYRQQYVASGGARL